jgi:hypothetical protein
MKKCKTAGKLIVIGLSALCVLLLFSSTAYAITSESQKVITPTKMKEWDNGAKVTRTSSGTGSNYQVSVTADTNGLKNGYYSIYLYDITARYIKPYDGICFNFKNENNAAVEINLTLTVNSKISATMADSSYAILEAADQSVREAIVPAYGTISVPANFEGTVYVPFSKLYTSAGKSVSLTQIQSWGVTAVMSEDQQIKYRIGNIALLSGSVASMKDSCYLIALSGNSKITIPHTGSVLEFYQAKVKDLDGHPVNQEATFFLKKGISGVTISKDGKLEVSSDCVATNITVCARLKNGVSQGELAVSLQRGGTAVGIPKASDVPKIITAADIKLNKLINVIRFVAIVIVACFGAIFYKWFSESKTNNIKIKNKLYQLGNDYEEEEKP